jgi:hypothetical protein
MWTFCISSRLGCTERGQEGVFADFARVAVPASTLLGEAAVMKKGSGIDSRRVFYGPNRFRRSGKFMQPFKALFALLGPGTFGALSANAGARKR